MAQILDLGKLRLNWLGEYSGATTYSYNDVVTYGPNTYVYVATSATAGVAPTVTANWTKLVEGLRYRGEYADATQYFVNDVVIDGVNTYIVSTAHTSANPAVSNPNANLTIIALGQQGIPSQTGNINKVLQTDGNSASWTATTSLTKGYWGTTQGGAASDFETDATLTDVASVFAKSSSDFAQLVMVNPSNGANASADLIIYTADGDNDSGWIDMGITSNNFSALTYGITGPHDGYIFMSAPRGTIFDISAARVVGSTATLTTTVAHGYSVGNIVKIEGVADGGGTGLTDQLVTLTAVSSTTFSFATTVTPFSEVNLSPFGSTYKPKGDGNMVFATDKTGLANAIVFAAGGFVSGTSQMTIYPEDKVDISIATASTSTSTGALVVAGGVGIGEHVNVDGSVVLGDQLLAGPDVAQTQINLGYTNAAAVFNFDNESQDNLYAQIAFKNDDPTSSTDFIVYSDNGYDEYGWASFGITGSDFGDPLFPLTGANDAYIFYDAPLETTGTITNKALTSNVATLTIGAGVPAEVKVGSKVVVTGVDATFNGTYKVTAVTATTFSYAKTESNVTSTSASGTATFNGGSQGNLVFATGENGSDNKIIFAAGGFSTGNTQMEITPDVNVHIEIPTPSTSPTTGALTVVGGVGITGDVNIAGSITFGGTGTQVSTANLAVTAPFIFTGDNSTTSANDLGLVVEGKYTVTNIPAAKVVNKALTSNVATLTTFEAHNLAVNDSVTIANVDATFNGTYIVDSVPTSTTFTYAKTASQVTSTRIGDVSYSINNKVLSANVATLTTTATHDFLVNEVVEITGVDATFNGTYTIAAITSTTFSYEKNASNVTSAAVSPVGTATVNRSTATATAPSVTRTRYSAFSKDATDQVWKLVSNISTEPTTIIDYSQDTYGNGVDIAYDDFKLKSLDATGNISAAGTLASTGNFAVNTDKFQVTATNGNTSVAGTLAVTGATTITNDLAVNGGDITTTATTFNLIDTNATTANIARAATSLTIGATTGTATIRNATTAISGAATVGSTLGVTGTSTFTGAATFNGGATITGTTEVQELREVVAAVTLSSNTGTLDWTAGNVYYIATAPTAAMTFNVTNLPTTDGYIYTLNIFVTQGSTGYIPTTFQIGGASQTIRWAGGTAPSATNSAGKIDIFTFSLQRASGVWIVYGTAASNF